MIDRKHSKSTQNDFLMQLQVIVKKTSNIHIQGEKKYGIKFGAGIFKDVEGPQNLFF